MHNMLKELSLYYSKNVKNMFINNTYLDHTMLSILL